MGNKTQHRIRLFATFGLLMAFGTLLIALAAIDMQAGSEGKLPIVALLIASPLFAYTISMIWRYRLVLINEEAESTSQEKRKRERLDTVLRDLSDEDLLRLKKRLLDGSIDNDLLQEQLAGDDGEIMYLEDN